MSLNPAPHRVSRRNRVASLLALVLGIGSLTAFAVHPAVAQSTATGAGGQTLTVSSTTDLDPSGASVQVTGSGYDTEKGIYVSFCVLPPPVSCRRRAVVASTSQERVVARSGSPPTLRSTPRA